MNTEISSVAELPQGVGDEQEAAHYRLRERGGQAFFGSDAAYGRLGMDQQATRRTEEGTLADGRPAERIVIGVDQSEAARSVLEFGLRDAARRGAAVEIITAYHNLEYWAVSYGMPTPPTADEDIKSNVTASTQALVDEVRAALPADVALPAALKVEARLGAPANVLLEAARGADLLIVGHRGHGGFASMVLGSVSMHCVLHATCSVTVVRPMSATDSATPPGVTPGGDGHQPA